MSEDWMKKQRAKFESGEYKLPEFLQQYVHPYHFVHLHPDNSGQLRYIKNPENGEAELYSRISVVGYLEKFTGISFSSREEISKIFARIIMDEDGLKFASTSEEIVQVYLNYNASVSNLANSCMRHSFAHLPFHPTYAYGAGDLNVAFLIDKEGRTTERAVVWPEMKIYGRVYGTSLLHSLLQKRGYKKSAYYEEGTMRSFVGAKLLAIEIPNYKGTYLMPYIDEKIYARLYGDYLVLQDGSNATNATSHLFLQVRYQNGTTNRELDDIFMCENCSSPIPRQNGTNIIVAFPHRLPVTKRYCPQCIQLYGYICQEASAYFDKRACDPIIMADGEIWSTYQFSGNGFVCPITGKNYPNREGSYIYDENGISREMCGPEAIRHKSKQCQFDLKHYPLDVVFISVHRKRRGSNDTIVEYQIPKYQADYRDDIRIVDGQYVEYVLF